jgi:hypothetical protein
MNANSYSRQGYGDGAKCSKGVRLKKTLDSGVSRVEFDPQVFKYFCRKD